jgi:hypothetical protein
LYVLRVGGPSYLFKYLDEQCFRFNNRGK